MEAGFLKRSSASFLFISFLCFLLNKMSPLGEKTSRTVKK